MLAWAVISDNRTDSSGIWLWRNRRGIGRNCEAAIRFVPGDMCNLSLSPAGEEEEEFRNDSALLEIAWYWSCDFVGPLSPIAPE